MSDSDALAVIEDLPWVGHVRETERDGATHRVDTAVTVLRDAHERHDLQNAGATIEAVSCAGSGRTLRVYVRV